MALFMGMERTEQISKALETEMKIEVKKKKKRTSQRELSCKLHWVYGTVLAPQEESRVRKTESLP